MSRLVLIDYLSLFFTDAYLIREIKNWLVSYEYGYKEFSSNEYGCNQIDYCMRRNGVFEIRDHFSRDRFISGYTFLAKGPLAEKLFDELFEKENPFMRSTFKLSRLDGKVTKNLEGEDFVFEEKAFATEGLMKKRGFGVKYNKEEEDRYQNKKEILYFCKKGEYKRSKNRIGRAYTKQKRISYEMELKRDATNLKASKNQVSFEYFLLVEPNKEAFLDLLERDFKNFFKPFLEFPLFSPLNLKFFFEDLHDIRETPGDSVYLVLAQNNLNQTHWFFIFCLYFLTSSACKGYLFCEDSRDFFHICFNLDELMGLLARENLTRNRSRVIATLKELVSLRGSQTINANQYRNVPLFGVLNITKYENNRIIIDLEIHRDLFLNISSGCLHVNYSFCNEFFRELDKKYQGKKPSEVQFVFEKILTDLNHNIGPVTLDLNNVFPSCWSYRKKNTQKEFAIFLLHLLEKKNYLSLKELDTNVFSICKKYPKEFIDSPKEFIGSHKNFVTATVNSTSNLGGFEVPCLPDGSFNEEFLTSNLTSNLKGFEVPCLPDGTGFDNEELISPIRNFDFVADDDDPPF